MISIYIDSHTTHEASLLLGRPYYTYIYTLQVHLSLYMPVFGSYHIHLSLHIPPLGHNVAPSLKNICPKSFAIKGFPCDEIK
jgi:hypothetical protein